MSACISVDLNYFRRVKLTIEKCLLQIIVKRSFFLAVPATLASSLAFMLPVATGPNALAFIYGRISISDMMKCGALTTEFLKNKTHFNDKFNFFNFCVLNVLGFVTIFVFSKFYMPVILETDNHNQEWLSTNFTCT